MKILLIYPSFKQQEIFSYLYKSDSILPPLGMAYIASYLITQGHDVELIDSVALSLGTEQIKNIIKEETPDIIGATANSPVYCRALEIVRIAKEVSPKIHTVLGGYHPTMFPRDVLANNYVDYIVQGEGELTMAELCSSIAQIRKPDSILGLGFKKDGEIIINKPRPFIQDLDSLPYPAYHLLPMKKYNVPGCFSRYSNQVSIISSRGCPASCYFCTSPGFWKRTVRFHSPEYIIGNMNYVYENFGIKSFQLRDDNFTTSRHRVMEFCDTALKNKYKFEWDCYSRFDYIDKEMLEKMKQAGCYQVSLGVETGNNKTLEIIKGLTKDTIKEKMNILKKTKLKTRLFFIIGPPAQSTKEIAETVDFAISLSPDLFIANISIPWPGSRYYEDMRKKNLVPDYTIHPVTIYESPCDLAPFNKKKLDELITMSYRKFYIRLAYVLKMFFSIRSFAGYKRHFINAYSLLQFIFKAQKNV